jgi:hypothetical protein
MGTGNRQKQPLDESYWLEVIAKCLCHLCLRETDLQKATKLEKASFLEALGLSQDDAAAIVGSTKESLKELKRQANKRKRAK